MQLETRDHVPLLTAMLSIAALGLIFSAVLGVIPTRLLPRSEWFIGLIPHLNVVISVIAIGTIIGGWRAIRRGEVESHRRRMLAAFVLFGAFLAFYLYRVTLEGPTDFGGPDTVYQFLYLPMLAIHILLAIVCVPLLLYVLLLAVSRPVEEIYRSRHRSVGQIAAVLWLISFSLGIAVYAMLYVVY
jgi:Predicted membrane protein